MKFSLLIPGLLLSLFSAKAQLFPHLRFQQFYDNTGDDLPQRIIRSHDGHLLIGGHTIVPDSAEAHCADIWIIKVDTTGELLWDQEISMTGCEELRDMTATDDGGVIFVGVTNSLISHREKGDDTYWGDYLIGKIDSLGTVEWLQSYGGSQLDQAHAIQKGLYREYLVVGSSHSFDGDVGFNYGMSDSWALKIDNQGRTRFSQIMGGRNNDWATALTQCSNGDYLLAGMTNSHELGSASLGPLGNGLLVRMSQGGQVQWQQAYPAPAGGQLGFVWEAPGGQIIAAGHRQQAESGSDFWWLKTEANGQKLEEFVYADPSDEYLSAAIACEGGGHLLTGYAAPQANGAANTYAKGGEDFWLLRLDPFGRVVWRTTYGGPDDERCRDVLAYRPGVYYAIGEKPNTFGSEATRDLDFWLLRIDEYPTDSIQAEIFVRAKDFRINRDTPTRFRARCQYGERFLWDFGDGTQSTVQNPLKTYSLSGVYEIRLTVYMNENCQQTTTLTRKLEVW